MKALIQRVRHASVVAAGETVGAIDQGLLILLGVEQFDDADVAARLSHKVARYRVFSDDEGKMNRSLLDIEGGALVVSQFTLAANTEKGLRPSFSKAGAPQLAKLLYEGFAENLRAEGLRVATGQFAADMQVSLLNDGPVTFLLEAN